jgi:DNA-binding transcriptional MerR regulator
VENSVLRYLAIIRAARDFGLSQAEIESVAGDFNATRVRCSELADALADLILGRGQASAEGLMF